MIIENLAEKNDAGVINLKKWDISSFSYALPLLFSFLYLDIDRMR